MRAAEANNSNKIRGTDGTAMTKHVMSGIQTKTVRTDDIRKTAPNAAIVTKVTNLPTANSRSQPMAADRVIIMGGAIIAMGGTDS